MREKRSRRDRRVGQRRGLSDSTRVAVELTLPQADALRWCANCGLEHIENMHPAAMEACRRALGKIIEAMGLEAYRHEGSVYGRRKLRVRFGDMH